MHDETNKYQVLLSGHWYSSVQVLARRAPQRHHELVRHSAEPHCGSDLPPNQPPGHHWGSVDFSCQPHLLIPRGMRTKICVSSGRHDQGSAILSL